MLTFVACHPHNKKVDGPTVKSYGPFVAPKGTPRSGEEGNNGTWPLEHRLWVHCDRGDGTTPESQAASLNAKLLSARKAASRTRAGDAAVFVVGASNAHVLCHDTAKGLDGTRKLIAASRRLQRVRVLDRSQFCYPCFHGTMFL